MRRELLCLSTAIGVILLVLSSAQVVSSLPLLQVATVVSMGRPLEEAERAVAEAEQQLVGDTSSAADRTGAQVRLLGAAGRRPAPAQFSVAPSDQPTHC